MQQLGRLKITNDVQKPDEHVFTDSKISKTLKQNKPKQINIESNPTKTAEHQRQKILKPIRKKDLLSSQS